RSISAATSSSCFAGVLHHEVDSLLPIPVEVMHAGIDNEPAGAPDLVHKLSEFRIRIIVETHLVAERLGVQSPSFDKRSIASVTPKIRNILLLHRDGDLQVVSRNCLVQ